MEVLDGTGEGGDSCCGAVSVHDFLGCVSEEWWSDFVGVAVKSGKEDPELGALGLGLRGGRGSGRAAFLGVMSLVNESDVRTDRVSGIGATMTEEVLGLVVLWSLRVVRADVIVSTAFQSSTSSSVSARLWMVAVAAQCWFGLSGGRSSVVF